MKTFETLLNLGKPKRKPTPIAIRLSQTWGLLWSRFLEVVETSKTKLFKTMLKSLALSGSKHENGEPVSITVQTSLGTFDLHELARAECVIVPVAGDSLRKIRITLVTNCGNIDLWL